MKKRSSYLLFLLFAVLAAFLAEAFYPDGETRTYHHEQAANAQYCETVPAGEFCTHLPLVRIDTRGGTLNHDTEILTTVEILDNAGGHNHLDSQPALTADTLMKLRGNTSAYFSKQQYRLTFVDADGFDPQSQDPQTLLHVSRSVMGMPAESEWILNGPFLDKTMMRNYLMYNLSGEIMDWAPNVRYCEVILDGEYQGLYLMVEVVKADKNRVSLASPDPRNPATGYMLNRERFGQTNYPLYNFGTYSMHTGNELGITFPGIRSGRSDAQLEYIRQNISAIEKMLYSLDYDHPQRGYKSALDVESFVDYYLLNEFSMNMDSGAVSTYLHKDIRSKLVMGPVWDFNNAFDNNEPFAIPYDDFYLINMPYYTMLLKDEQFVEKVIQRYAVLRQSVLSEAYIFQILEETIAFLGPAIERDDTVWGYTYLGSRLLSFDREGELLNYNRNPRNYDQAVQQLKDAIHERGAFLDEYIHVLRQFCAESKVKQWN